MEAPKPQLPEPFKALSRLTEGKPTVRQATALTKALDSVPGLQAWLRWHRQTAVRALRDEQGMSRDEIAGRLGVTPQRVSDIASGHGASKTAEPPQLPEPFKALSRLGEGKPTIRQAEVLTKALDSIPDLQACLRVARQVTVRALRDEQGMSAREIAEHLGVKTQRIYDITSGHRSTASRKRKPAASQADG